jgi:hypothetical protein
MLTNAGVTRAKASAMPYKLTDGGGLYLEVTPAGGKHWPYRFRLNVKVKAVCRKTCSARRHRGRRPQADRLL